MKLEDEDPIETWEAEMDKEQDFWREYVKQLDKCKQDCQISSKTMFGILFGGATLLYVISVAILILGGFECKI